MLRLVHLVLNKIYEFFFVFFICGFVYMIQLAFDASVNAFLSFGTRVYKRILVSEFYLKKSHTCEEGGAYLRISF